MGILLFGISLLLWNCNQNVGDEETFIPLTTSKYQSLDIEETTSFLSDFKSKKYLKKSAKGINLDIDINSLNFENVENSELSMPVFEAITKHAAIESKVFLIKVNDSIQGFLLNRIVKKDDNSSKFSGIISVTNLEGKFINAYRIENGDFITQFVKKTTSNNPVFHAKASDPEGCDESLDPSSEFCNQGLEEIVIVSNGGGNSNSNSNSNTGTGLNFNNSWGWSFPSSNISGGGTGNSSNSSNTVNVFPCDDPIHGCDKECGQGEIYDEISGECVEYQIFNKLTGKDKCIYTELKKLNLFKQTIGKFSNGKYNLTVKYGTKCNGGAGEEACTDASDLHNGNLTIKILGSGNQSLDFAATLLHEGIHAEIHKYVDEHKKGIDPNNRKSVFHYYNYYSAKNNDRFETSIAQHQHMQDVFVIPIAKAIRKLDNYRLPLENYYGFGWEGLKEDYDYDNYIDINGKVQVMTPEKYRGYINKMHNVISTTKFKEILKNCN